MRERQVELDFVRGLALVLMVTSHTGFTYALAMKREPGEAARWLWQIGETAPAWFFFAFGMTFDQLRAKSASVVRHRLWLFFCLAIVHNALLGGLMQLDFLAFLWLAQVTLLAIERFLEPRDWHYAVAWCGFVSSMLARPHGYWDEWVRAIVPGFFPLMPWILFVVAGLLYQRARAARAWWPLGVGLVVLSLSMALAQGWIGWSSWAFNKLVLSAPYVLLLTGCALIACEAVRSFPDAYRRLPVVPRLLGFLSRNLLLGTVLHYLSVFGFFAIAYAFVPIPVLRERQLAGVALATLASLACLALLIAFARRWWERGPAPPFRVREDVVALFGMLLGVLLMKLREDALAHPSRDPVAIWLLYTGGFVAVMTRLALGLGSEPAAPARSRG
jgi:hypothetical protein